MSNLEASGLFKSFGTGAATVPVLNGVDLEVRTGEFLAITGASGSGKSTLLQILGCLDRPSKGSYRVGGRDVAGLSDCELSRLRSNEIGFVFQKFHLLPGLSVFENVSIPFLYAAHPPADPLARVNEVLVQVGLAHRASHRPSELSGGETQRVAIARALVNRPRLILADEPTGNLDSVSGNSILELLEEIHGGGGTLIIVTHDSGVAARAERVVQLKEGRFDG